MVSATSIRKEMPLNRDKLRATYDRRAANYDRTVGAAEKIALGELRARFAAEPRGETLEIACGSGLNFPYYTSAVTRAAGIDLSRAMLDRAAERAKSLGMAIDLIQMDARQLAFASASFDTVAISLALCTVADPAAALREIARVCRPTGNVVLLEHVLSPFRPIAAIQRWLSPLQERFIGCHLDRTTIDIARECGFEIISERRRFAGVFRLAVGRPPAL